jgi:hypothetical protein
MAACIVIAAKFVLHRKIAFPTAAKGAAAVAVNRQKNIDEAIERSPLDAVHRAVTAGAFTCVDDMQLPRRPQISKTRHA